MIYSAQMAHVHKDYIINHQKNRTIGSHLESFELVRFTRVQFLIIRDI